MQNHDYFKAIVDQMEHGGREAMLYDLQHADLSNFNPRQIPMTDALQDQKFRSMDRSRNGGFRSSRRAASCLVTRGGKRR
jgi:hypothetical protein